MAFLIPDKTITAAVGGGTIVIKQKITPDSARATKYICSYVKKGDPVKPCAKLAGGTGKPKGITVHNTDEITAASGTTPAEQYARATWPNQNMGGIAVHFWVWHNDIWQQLSEDERGWHAADGSTRRSSQRAGETIGGNLDTISIECIGADAESEDTTAKLVAYLLQKHGLSPETDVYTHNYFMGLPNKIVNGVSKNCPLYILPHWGAFMETVKKYYAGFNKVNTSGYTAIAGTTAATAAQMRAYLLLKNPQAAGFAANLPEIYIEEAAAEGIRADVAFAQSCLETGNFKFGGDVKPEQNNFAGIGATGGGVAGNKFTTPREGVRAQIQHLKAYANAEPLKGECVDPRFKYVTRASAPYVEWLGIPENPNGKGWASGAGYGGKILAILAAILNTKAGQEQIKPSAPVETIKVGSTVKLKQGAKTYTGGTLASFVYARNHIVKEINGDRAVITYGGVVVAAVKLADLTLIKA
ncbi:N-acetylmuramoyl-L-alanine amidase [Caproiciproducens galactitolivorans]|uniref:N-acetylmuramoyl-L-alanine amidase n=1 Tax=Caproiciproducens galactitolivorans TaxID=642589 RepID=UPI00240A355D|nr:N-acetylmuramoyl-L-alanine amidase [Caproiciproducens galactitolivorans]